MDRTVMVRLQYDGSGFSGWQRQRTGRTVQGEMEAVLERLCGRRIAAHAAGRTDAGVHAMGMAVSVTIPERWTPLDLHRAVNALLPRDCWVDEVVETIPGFHARKHAVTRSYEYRIGTDAASRSPFRRPFEWALERDLDEAALHSAGATIVGSHEFRAFAVQTQDKPDCRCEVRTAQWCRREDAVGFRFGIVANRFLHHMVRILVGTMVDIALTRRDPSDLGRLLESDPEVRASPPAPPEGLYFMHATYPTSCFPDLP
jgi:tRNA pseudouridine38-40 synthase